MEKFYLNEVGSLVTMSAVENQSNLISVILPVYNGEKYLSQSIKSCLNQTHKNLELIIVNDASTDDSLKISSFFAQKDDRVKIISNSSNKKLPASLNIGHQNASGEFVTWISDDNFFSPQALEKMLSTLLYEDSDIVYSNFEIIDSSGLRIGQYNFDSENTMLLENIIRASFLYRIEVYQRNNGYNENLFRIEDYAFWLMASLHSKFYHIPEELYSYRSHEESLTSGKTISQFSFEAEYLEKVKKMYQIYFETLKLRRAESLSVIFKDLHLHQELEILPLLQSYKSLVKDLKIVLDKYGREKILKEIDLRIRNIILRYSSNQKISVLYFVIINRPKILFSYSKKKSFKIIYKCIF